MIEIKLNNAKIFFNQAHNFVGLLDLINEIMYGDSITNEASKRAFEKWNDPKNEHLIPIMWFEL